MRREALAPPLGELADAKRLTERVYKDVVRMWRASNARPYEDLSCNTCRGGQWPPAQPSP